MMVLSSEFHSGFSVRSPSIHPSLLLFSLRFP
ncbi:unnamed protein product [Linum tenue]|uniref:Uncharacterized protein n=1 Tax=Linum tenue TaxID=586396 RepID=A0AAV0I7M8_9ROSI|nr:unnamed protein product [Linum tenue]